MNEIFTNVYCPFFGTLAFAILYQVPRKYYLACGLTGVYGWAMYYLFTFITTPAISAFAGTMVVVLISRMLTVRMKCPITIFLISGIFPLVPGGGIYQTVYYVVTNQMEMAASKGMTAIKMAFGIVLGIAIVVSIPRECFKIDHWRQVYRQKTGQNS